MDIHGALKVAEVVASGGQSSEGTKDGSKRGRDDARTELGNSWVVTPFTENTALEASLQKASLISEVSCTSDPLTLRLKPQGSCLSTEEDVPSGEGQLILDITDAFCNDDSKAVSCVKGAASVQVVDVSVPRLYITGTFDLKKTLSYMGVTKIFEEHGDLTKISPSRSLKVSKY
ncbi:hypothetical protein P7K49_018539 [Saguinus oedipus]|uniref:Serpin domain-containing protein n=1 Tax=Saguinus oedipus TaxID=9490 RepID=A0ABQ9V5N5_SAGOE|nr:hypothetical protein P7K49_018539 [Saguinus oedipus]